MVYLDGIKTLRANFTYNIRSKWTSFCFAIDFPGDQWELFINGNPFGYQVSKLRRLDGRMSNATKLPMIVRIGIYYFDNKPLIGKIIDINFWDR